MTIELGDIIAWGSVGGAILGGVWKFYTFSKSQAEREVELDNKLLRLETEQKRSSDEMSKFVAEYREMENSRQDSVRKMEERFDTKIEKLDEKHSTLYNAGLSEVKQAIVKQGDKIDKLMEILISQNSGK